MKIYQGYISPGFEKFGFLEMFKLRAYDDGDAPLVVFGCYKSTDVDVIKAHRNHVVVIWIGNDSWKTDDVRQSNVTNATWLPPLYRFMREKKQADIRLLKIPTLQKPNPIVKGDKIYTYLNLSKPDYHGSKIINELNLGERLLIGDGSITKEDWYSGVCDEFYSKTFIGLFLSGYVGGCFSALEMGLRGIRVVTNVFEFPHTIAWKSKKDIIEAIKWEETRIGDKNEWLAVQVFDQCAHDMDCFDLDELCLD